MPLKTIIPAGLDLTKPAQNVAVNKMKKTFGAQQRASLARIRDFKMRKKRNLSPLKCSPLSNKGFLVSGVAERERMPLTRTKTSPTRLSQKANVVNLLWERFFSLTFFLPPTINLYFINFTQHRSIKNCTSFSEVHDELIRRVPITHCCRQKVSLKKLFGLFKASVVKILDLK